jgi:hypothetical protein
MAPCFNNINLGNPTGYVTHHQVKIQQLYALPTLNFCVLSYLRTNRLVSHHKLIVFIIESKNVYCAVRTGSLNKTVCASSLKGLYQS